MSASTRICLVTAAVSVVTLGLGTHRAQAQETAQTYVITSISQTAQDRAVVREVLSLEQNGEHARLRVANGDGSLFLTPVALTTQGQIDSRSQDRSVTCYNMAMGVLAHQSVQSGPASVFMTFASSVVQIPLSLQATSEQGPMRTVALEGETAGVLRNGDTATDAGLIVHAQVGEENGDLRSATFDEVNYVGDPSHVIGRSTCILERQAPTAHPVTQT